MGKHPKFLTQLMSKIDIMVLQEIAQEMHELKISNYLQKLANDGGTPKYARPMCVSKLEPKKNDDLIKDIDNLKKALGQ